MVDFGMAENKSEGFMVWKLISNYKKCLSDILDLEIGYRFTIGFLFQIAVNSKTVLGILTCSKPEDWLQLKQTHLFGSEYTPTRSTVYGTKHQQPPRWITK